MLQYSKGASLHKFLFLLGFSSSQLEIGGKGGGALFNPFLFIKYKRLFISSQGFSTLEKKHPDMSSKGNAAHPVGFDSPWQIVMAVWRPFCLYSNFLGGV
jgi:hypothetical protein